MHFIHEQSQADNTLNILSGMPMLMIVRVQNE